MSVPETWSEKRHAAGWVPLLSGLLAEQTEAMVDRIAAALAPVEAGDFEKEERAASLAGGHAGIALLEAYVPREGHSAAPVGDGPRSHLLRALEMLEELPMQAGLFSGFTGVGWALAHLERRGLLECEDGSFEEIDHLVEAAMERSNPGQYDLVSGLVGWGVYATERLPSPVAYRMLEKVVLRLEDHAEQIENGTTWVTPPELLVPNQRKLAPGGYYNLGVAHGVPGVISLLASAYRAGVLPARCRAILDAAVQWLLEQEDLESPSPAFPFWVARGGSERQGRRQAWCYGDLGIAAVLLDVADTLRVQRWRSEALRIALGAASCPPERCGVVDAGLCHGAAGLAHLFNRIYQVSGVEELGDAARMWVERTLRLGRQTKGIAGYVAYRPDAGNGDWVADPGLLTGAAGIGLGLRAAVSSEPPSWDRLFLLSGLDLDEETGP